MSKEKISHEEFILFIGEFLRVLNMSHPPYPPKRKVKKK